VETIYLDIIPSGVNPSCNVSQGDEGRAIRVYLLESGSPYELSGSETLTLHVEKPDKDFIESELVNAGGSFIDFTVNGELTDKSGKCYCKINIEDGDIKIGSSGFYIIVEKAP
jgi:hypothetical protein